MKINKNVKNIVTSLRPDPTNGQRQSNYFLAIAGELFECVWHSVGLGLKGLRVLIIVVFVWSLLGEYTFYRAYEDILGNQRFSDQEAVFPKF